MCVSNPSLRHWRRRSRVRGKTFLLVLKSECGMLKTYQVERGRKQKVVPEGRGRYYYSGYNPGWMGNRWFCFSRRDTQTNTHTQEMPPKRYYRRRDGDGGVSYFQVFPTVRSCTYIFFLNPLPFTIGNKLFLFGVPHTCQCSCRVYTHTHTPTPVIQEEAKNVHGNY